MIRLSHRVRTSLLLCAILFGWTCWSSAGHGAEIEFLSGNKVECKVLSKDTETVTVEVTMGGQTIKRTYKLNTVHAVTINNKRYVINEKTVGGKSGESSPGGSKSGGGTSGGPSGSSASGKASAGGATLRPKAEVEALINRLGREPPEWFESTPLNYPQSLDLSWPEKPEGGWNNQKNVGQYIWDVINPNPSRWREGVKLMHHLLTLHKDDAAKRTRAMNELGRMYHDLHQDYARAAFWWRQAGADRPGATNHRSTVSLAECYWRLGNRQMAVDALPKQTYSPFIVKLWVDLGDLTRAQQALKSYESAPDNGLDLVLLAIADGYRQAGRPREALAHYERVLAMSTTGNAKGRLERSHGRAQASIEAIKLFDLADVSRVADGVYRSESRGYEGPVKVEVAVKSGRIESVRVTEHKEKQFYSAITDTSTKIVAKQGVKGVDATSNATITSEAIINATAKALAAGAKGSGAD